MAMVYFSQRCERSADRARSHGESDRCAFAAESFLAFSKAFPRIFARAADRIAESIGEGDEAAPSVQGNATPLALIVGKVQLNLQ
jgi:hypothetical protein